MSLTIGVMDSGAGGLSILKAIRLAVPYARLVYFADQAYAPYGDLTTEKVSERLCRIGRFFVQQGCQLMVVACNTATVAGISNLRAGLSIPVVGVEPAVKPACSASKRKRVTVLATPTTSTSARLLDLINLWRAESEVAVLASQKLASLIDRMPSSLPSLEQEVDLICMSIQAHDSDSLVLACTHYPLIKELFELRLNMVNIVEPSEGVTAQVLRLIDLHGLVTDNCHQATGSLELRSNGSEEAKLALNYWSSSFVNTPVLDTNVE